MNAHAAMRQYQQVNIQSGVTDASPHRLVQMLMEGALERIALAKGHIARHEIASKGEQIGQTISIVESLRASLNMDAGGEIAVNLSRLYDYITMRLLSANSLSDESILDEVAGLLVDIKSAWDAVPEEYRH